MVDEMRDKKVWAVVGATDNHEKYGYKIYMKLKKLGYKVYPVNPNVKSVDGDICYPNLASVPLCPEVVDMVVNPRRGVNIIEEAASLGIKNIWLQPGTVSQDVLAVIETHGLNSVQACVLVNL